MNELLLLVNPTAGHGRGARAGPRVLAELRAHGHRVREVSDVDLAGAVRRARAALDAGPDALVVVGGDGMVHAGVNVVAGTPVALGIVAVGSGNDFARSAGLPVHDPVSAAHRIDGGLAAGARRVDAALVSGTGLARPRWYAGVLSAGIDAAVNARANAYAFPAGRLRYLRAAVAELASYGPYGYRVSTQDGVWSGRGALVAVANGPAIGGGMRIAPDARIDDGLLDVVLAGALTRAQAAALLPRLYAGTHVSHPLVCVHRTRTAVLEPAPGGAPPPVAFADGERLGPLPLEIEVQPGAVLLLGASVGGIG
ncbi:MAG: diacylglycerol/lipid kinase family protein [Cellulomonadaceae bacterium]